MAGLGKPHGSGKCINKVFLSGNIGSTQEGSTGSGVSAFSILLAVDGKNEEAIWVRINVYGPLANRCKDSIEKGDYIVVEGELMERKKSNDDEITFLEIRASEVIFEDTLRTK